jgi:PGF-CTERM protein
MLRPPSATAAALVAVLVLASATTVGVAAINSPTTDSPATDPAAVTSAATHGSVDDATAVDVADAPTAPNASVDAWRAPARADTANASLESLREYASERDGPAPVTPDDRLLVEISVPGLDAAVANASGNASANATTRVLDALDENGHFAVRQTIETTLVEVQSKSLWLNASNAEARDVAGDDRYLLVVDPTHVLGVHASTFEDPDTAADAYRDDDADYRFDGVYERGLRTREVYTARYYANETADALAATSAGVQFLPAAAAIATEGPLEPRTNATVAGTTTVAPGTDLAVTARTDACVATESIATATDRGRFGATLDLEAVDAPAAVNVTVALAANRSRTLTAAPATLAVREPNATIAFDDQTTSTRYVSARANLTHGGFLALRYDDAVVDTATVNGAGAKQTVTLALPANATTGTYTVVAYRGTAGDPGQRYANGTASATITFQAETTTPPTTTTTPPTTTTTPPTTTTPTAGTTTGTDDAPTTTVVDDPIPGFGVPAALAALAATLLVVGRRVR